MNQEDTLATIDDAAFHAFLDELRAECLSSMTGAGRWTPAVPGAATGNVTTKGVESTCPA